jgi:hypothetical protein
MAKVKIQGHASGTGILTVTAPNTSTDRTITLPDATGTLLTEVADDAITLAKMASGTDGNIISYDASGNPVAIATGDDGQVLTSAGAGAPPAFEDATGGDNTPAFSMIGTGTQDFGDNVYVKILFEGTEEFDTDSACASSRFTVPSGEGGKYFVQLNVVGKSEFDLEDRLISKFYVNGSPDNRTYNKVRSIITNDNITVNHATILTLSAADYVEVYCYKDGNSAGVDGGTFGRFSGFKLLGV